jgi:cytochrome c biogenesis protein CcmG/thiol:disulfide interchange protein DsbE
MAKIKPLMLLPPLIFAGLAGVFYVGMQRDNPNDLPSTFIGQSAPAITTETLGSFEGVWATGFKRRRSEFGQFLGQLVSPLSRRTSRVVGIARAGHNHSWRKHQR